MDREKELEKQVSEYITVAKENQNVDVAALMMYSLQNQDKNFVSSKSKRWAYLISVSLPPLGALFALHYYMSDKDDAKHVANMCVILTVVSVLVFMLTFKIMSLGASTSVNQFGQASPKDILELTK